MSKHRRPITLLGSLINIINAMLVSLSTLRAYLIVLQGKRNK